MSAPDSLLKKALEFLERANTSSPPPTTPTEEPEKEQLRGTSYYDLLEEFPNLIVEDHQVDRVIQWLRSRGHIAVDIETHGHARRKEVFKKEALSFVKGIIRLIQFSDGETTFILDAQALSTGAVVRALSELVGKSLYLHNAIFDLPRILRTFGVDLLGEDIRDTMVLSRLLRAGQWEYVAAKNGGTATVEKKHNIRDVLVQEIGEEIDKETDHRWDQPLTEERLRYASDDVKHLQPLYHDLLEKVKKDGMLDAYKLI